MRRISRMILVTAGYNFRMWKKNMRVIAAFLLAFILCFMLTDKLVWFAGEQETTMQLVEPFIWTFGDGNSILLGSMLFLLLFGDLPFITTATPFFLIRENRKIWIAGQFLYIVGACVFYLMFILGSTGILCMKYLFPKNTWSYTAAILAYSEKGETLGIPAAVKTLEMSRPYQTMCCIFVLLLLYALVLMFLQMFFTLWKGQMAGVISALTFSAYGLLLNPDNLKTLLKLPDEFYYKARVIVGWISPLNQATYSMHNFGYDNLPSLKETFLIFGSILTILVFLSTRQMKRYNFQFRGTEE